MAAMPDARFVNALAVKPGGRFVNALAVKPGGRCYYWRDLVEWRALAVHGCHLGSCRVD